MTASLDVRETFFAGNGRMRIEEGFVVEFKHGQIDANGDRLNGRGNLVASLVGLDLDLPGVVHNVRVGQDALAIDNHAAACDFGGRLLAPRLVRIGKANRGKDFDQRVLELGGSDLFRCCGSRRRSGCGSGWRRWCLRVGGVRREEECGQRENGEERQDFRGTNNLGMHDRTEQDQGVNASLFCVDTKGRKITIS